MLVVSEPLSLSGSHDLTNTSAVRFHGQVEVHPYHQRLLKILPKEQK